VKRRKVEICNRLKPVYATLRIFKAGQSAVAHGTVQHT